MRDHDTAERETPADQHGTKDQHGTTDRNETKDRPGTVDRHGAADRHGAVEQREAAGPHGATGRREAAGLAPAPSERSTATTTSTDASVTDVGDRKSPESTNSPAGTAAGEPEARPGPLSGVAGRGDDEHVPDLLGQEDGDAYRKRWREIQGRFVDDPREAVHSADELVADVMKTLAAAFADHKHTLEGQWGEGRDADTEALRVALREYRSFFNRLLTTSTPQH
ncbi:hypothetical protein ACFUGD_34450 [Streptomyces sp. NPDC057217]|uniref:hypothetical protein n=1 Tax=Streptomyces sp. NPDC057217 TaxID=3346054 RepID=UPI00363A561C